MSYDGTSLHLEQDNAGFATLTFSEASSVNKLDRRTLTELEDVIQMLEHSPDTQGLIIRSGKSHFIVGADVHEFLGLFALPESELELWLTQVNRLFCRLETLPFPTISVLNGHVLGGGCELALSTDFRLAEPSVRIGLPETRLGIMPGWGGSVRLPRLIGLEPALDLIIGGEDVNPDQALSLGWIDAISPPDHILTEAKKMLTAAVNGTLNWHQHRQRKQQPLSYPEPELSLIMQLVTARLKQRVSAHYPAPFHAMQSMLSSHQQSFAQALETERAHFLILTRTPQAEALVGNFLNEQHVKNKARSLSAPTAVHRVSIIGAGIMGAGIAYQCLRQQCEVWIKDIRPDALQQCCHQVGELLERDLAKARLTAAQMAQCLSRLHGTLDDRTLADSDITIEAVSENVSLKQRLLQETERQLTPGALMTTNTSAIPITQLASGLTAADRFCGLHFFNPVPRMPLIEIIRGPHTSQAALSEVVAFALALGKTPIIVNDCPGFFVNRVLFAYLSAFRHLLSQGISPYQIDAVMEQYFGWPMGPARLLDTIGLDTAQHATQILAAGYPERMGLPAADGMEALIKLGWHGKKNGGGFYLYPDDGKAHYPNPEWPQIQDTPTMGAITEQELSARMMIPLLNEAVRCLQEGIIATPAEGDMALLLGLGFPAFRGGPFRYLQQWGLAHYIAAAEHHAAQGALYIVPETLHRMVQQGAHFY